MIIAISGTQGQGKTFILNHLEKEGYQVCYNTAARDILHDWNVTLTEVYSNPVKAKKFQIEILRIQTKINLENEKKNELIFTERSFADIFTYAMFALGNINTYDTWLKKYYSKCISLQHQYRSVIFLSGRKFTPEDDGIRSTNTEFGKCVDIVAEHYALDMCAKSMINYNHISLPNVGDRVDSIKRIVREIS